MKRTGKSVRSLRPKTGKGLPAMPARQVEIRFEETGWPVQVRTAAAVNGLQEFIAISPGACITKDNPGGLSIVPCAPRRLYHFRAK